MKFLVSVVIILTCSYSQAADFCKNLSGVEGTYCQSLITYYRHSINVVQSLNERNDIDPNSTFHKDCLLNGKPLSSQDPEFAACQKLYQKVYKNRVVKLDFVVGYLDNVETGNPEDGYLVDVLIDQITKKDCTTRDAGTCGFKKTDDATLFEKKVTFPDGSEKTVQVRIVQSSKTPSDQLNRSKDLIPFQDEQTKLAKGIFDNGLRHDDAVICVSHARNGGGCDFAPPHRRKDGSVDFEYYNNPKKNPEAKRNEKDMLASLSENPEPPAVIGLHTCYADVHFENDLRKINERRKSPSSRSGYVFSRKEMPYRGLFAQGFAVLDNLLSMRCETGFKAALTALKSSKEHVQDSEADAFPIPAPEIVGIFDHSTDN
jgi:hypothetical protein